jgi:ABC-type multidrug transport system fused ATPase/permease subunit
MTGERQAARIRSLYLKSVLRQEIAFFDVELTTGQIVTRMSGDTVLVQDAIGEKVNSSPLKMKSAEANFLLTITSLYKKLHNLTLTKIFRSASSNNLLLPS